MYDLIVNLGYWNWLLLGLALMALETVIPGIHFLWFGLAALITGAIAAAIASAGYGDAFAWPWQLVVFALLSVISVFGLRRVSGASDMSSDAPNLNVRAAQYVGRVVTVEDAIRGGRGKVRVGDTLWGAKGPDLPSGAKARVVGAEGIVLVVEPA